MSAPKSALMLVCHANTLLEQNFRQVAEQAGYVCEQVQQASELDISVAMGEATPDLLILLLPELSAFAIQQLQELDNHAACPVVLAVERHLSDHLPPAIEAGVDAYVVKGCEPDKAELLVAIACERHQSRQKLKNDVADAKTQLRERKLVERAKGILMESKQLSEQEAYRVMRKASMNGAQPLVQVAASVIQVSELLRA